MANTKITADVIEANAVLAVSIADENITSAKLADLAVTEGKIANSAITAGKIATDAVITAKIQNGAITSAKLDTNIAIAGTLGVTGDANFDSNTLFVDASANAVGIGTTSPSALLEIQTAGTSGLQDFQIFSRGVSPNYEVFKISRTAGSTELLANQNLTLSADYDNNHTSVDSNVIFKTDNTERLRIDSNGNVGINTSSPNGKLTVSNGSGAQFEFFPENSTDTNLFMNYDRTSSAYQNLQTRAATHQFLISDSEKMRIDTSGNVGIGTSSPAYNLHVEKLSASGNVDLLVKNTGTDGTSNTRIMSYVGASGGDPKIGLGISGVRDYFFRIDNSDSDKLKLDTNGSDIVTIDTSGNVGIGTASPATNLHIQSASEPAITLFHTAVQAAQIGLDSSGSLTFGIDGSTGATERMKINTSGNVGIGISSPTEKLDVNGGTIIRGALTNGASSGNGLRFEHTSDIGQIYSLEPNVAWRELRTNASQQTFYIAGGEKMRLDSSGSLLVGTTTAGAKFHVNGGGGSSAQCFLFDGFGYGVAAAGAFNHTASLPNGTATGDIFYFQYQGTGVGEVDITTTSTNYRTSSDYRLKENVDYDFTALDRVAQLKPARFNFIAAADTTVDGFLAHEVQDIVPNAVAGEKDGEKMQSIDHSKLVPLLTKAIQEQQALIESLTTRLETLENA
jgi:hypothetical protein